MKPINSAVSRELAQKVLTVVDHGLVKGLGTAKVGAMCVEAAVCFAMGLPHSDQPTCVAPAVRTFKIGINDANWSSSAARAKGLRRIAVAQLGSDQIDEVKFAMEVALRTVNIIVPIALRAAAELAAKPHKEALEKAAYACEVAKDLDAARYAASDAASYASDAAARSASYAASSAARSASDAARSASYAARSAARSARYAASSAARSASSAASSASSAASSASDAARSASSASDAVLAQASDIGLEALIQCFSPGCAYLDLCPKPE
jgi:hypothetical protein